MDLSRQPLGFSLINKGYNFKVALAPKTLAPGCDLDLNVAVKNVVIEHNVRDKGEVETSTVLGRRHEHDISFFTQRTDGFIFLRADAAQDAERYRKGFARIGNEAR
jgi:hypothetical protein